LTIEAVPKLQFLEQLLTPGENCMSRKSLPYNKLAIFSESLFQNQPGFGTSSIYKNNDIYNLRSNYAYN
jgi:hypothetical protein